VIHLTNEELIKALIHNTNIPLFVKDKKRIRYKDYIQIDRTGVTAWDYEQKEWDWFVEKLTALHKLFYLTSS